MAHNYRVQKKLFMNLQKCNWREIIFPPKKLRNNNAGEIIQFSPNCVWSWFIFQHARKEWFCSRDIYNSKERRKVKNSYLNFLEHDGIIVAYNGIVSSCCNFCVDLLSALLLVAMQTRDDEFGSIFYDFFCSSSSFWIFFIIFFYLCMYNKKCII